jgi:hypothetical protein
MRLKAQGEAPARGRPWHAGRQSASAFKQQARHPDRDDGLKVAHIQMPPGAFLPVFDFRPLVGFGMPPDLAAGALHADPHLPRFPVDYDVHHLPRGLQFQ